jgi:hypothetical protein
VMLMFKKKNKKNQKFELLTSFDSINPVIKLI